MSRPSRLRRLRGQAMAEYSALLWFMVGAVFFVGPPVIEQFFLALQLYVDTFFYMLNLSF